MIRTIAIAAAALLLLCDATQAQVVAALDAGKPTLRSHVTVTGDVVRIGDLIENAGTAANVAVFRAPDLGSTGSVPAGSVIEAVRPHAVDDLDTGGVSEVTVTRAARSIAAKDIEDGIAEALGAQFSLGAPEDVAFRFDRELRAVHLDPSVKGELRVGRINFDARSGRFDATLNVGPITTLRFTGIATATVEVATLSRPLTRGETIKAGDVTAQRRPRADAGDSPATVRDALGQAVRTAMSAGRTLRTADLAKPELVRRDENVTLVFEVPGIMLTIRGKALEAGAEGDMISVLNAQSKRTVQGVVAGPGRVIVSNTAPRLAAREPGNSVSPNARIRAE